MNNTDSILHTKGESIFLDDMPVLPGTLFCKVYSSPFAHAKILKTNIKKAASVEKVVSIITANDIPGDNQIGGIIEDEPLLANGEVHFMGQPIALILAEDEAAARKALKEIDIEFEELEPVLDPREAFKKNSLIIPPRTFSLGNTEVAWKECDIIVEDQVDSGGQEHLYLETQAAMAIPDENNKIKVYSSTQAPTGVQKAIARVLGIPMNSVEVDVKRLGGGFGGKEDQATAWAAMAALAAFKLKLPVKLVLSRNEDMRMTGKRHPYSSDFKLGLKKDGSILAYEVTFYQNAGASADLSTAILERTLFHTTNSYYIPNVKATAISCKTNLPPFTAFRGFGGPQAMFVMESAIYKAAEKLNIDPYIIQKKNLLFEDAEFPYGQHANKCNAQKCFENFEREYKINDIQKDIHSFNITNKYLKKGFALMPVCFGISFTTTFLNQASSLVNIYTDGSVNISTAAIEMGQGVNRKILLTAARTFSISESRIKIDSTNTGRIANTSPTAASSSADLNGKATELACKNILNSLLELAKEELKAEKEDIITIEDEEIYLNREKTGINWLQLIRLAYIKRICLQSHSYYATPDLNFDRTKEKGIPFAYHVYGVAGIEVTIDILRGIYSIDSIKVIHDIGKTIDATVDKGQIEGGIMQGLGWMTIEELIYNSKGKLTTDTLSAYKVPDIYFSPEEMVINFLENSENEPGILKSKAVGEPPFMYGIGVYFAIMNAVKEYKHEAIVKYDAPLTNEKLFMTLIK
jgi:xanthine dehydrogenase large subunit